MLSLPLLSHLEPEGIKLYRIGILKAISCTPHSRSTFLTESGRELLIVLILICSDGKTILQGCIYLQKVSSNLSSNTPLAI